MGLARLRAVPLARVTLGPRNVQTGAIVVTLYTHGTETSPSPYPHPTPKELPYRKCLEKEYKAVGGWQG